MVITNSKDLKIAMNLKDIVCFVGFSQRYDGFDIFIWDEQRNLQSSLWRKKQEISVNFKELPRCKRVSFVSSKWRMWLVVRFPQIYLPSQNLRICQNMQKSSRNSYTKQLTTIINVCLIHIFYSLLQHSSKLQQVLLSLTYKKTHKFYIAIFQLKLYQFCTKLWIQNKDIINVTSIVGYLTVEIVLLVLLAIQTQNSNNKYQIYMIGSLSFIKLSLNLPIFSHILCIAKQSIIMQEHHIVILSILAIFISIGTQILFIKFNFTILYKTNHIADQLHTNIQWIVEVIKKITIIYITFRIEISYGQKIFLTVLLLFISVLRLVQILKEKICVFDEITEMLKYLKEIFLVSFYFIGALQFYIDIVRQNMGVGLVTIFLFSYRAYQNCLQTLRQELLNKKLSEIDQQKQAIAYIRLLYRIYQNFSDESKCIALISIIKQHRNQCNNPQCYCTLLIKFKTLQFQNMEHQEYLMKYFLGCYEDLTIKCQGSQIQKGFLTFNVEVLKKFPQFSYNISSYKNKNLSMVDQYGLYLLEREAKKLYKQQNAFSNSSVNLVAAKLFENEQRIQFLYQNCILIAQNFATVYELNKKNICDLNEMQTYLSSSFKLMNKVSNIIQNTISQDSISLEVLNLSLFYSTFLTNSEEISRVLKKRLKFVLSKLAFKELKDINFNINLYSENGCLIGSTVEEDKFGFLTDISKNTHRIFNFPRNQMLLGMDVNKLLVPCLREEHAKILKYWINTGESRFSRLGVFLEYYCCDYYEFVMKCYAKFQISVMEDRLIAYLGLIKKQKQESVIAVDKNDVINCCSKKVKDMFGKELKRDKIQDIIGHDEWQKVKIYLQDQKTVNLIVEIKNGDENSKLRRLAKDQNQLRKDIQSFDFKSYMEHISLEDKDKEQVTSEIILQNVSYEDSYEIAENMSKVTAGLLKPTFKPKPSKDKKKNEELKYAYAKVTKQYLNTEYFYLIQVQSLHSQQQFNDEHSFHFASRERGKTIIKSESIQSKMSTIRLISPNSHPINKLSQENQVHNDGNKNIFEIHSSISSIHSTEEHFSIRKIIAILEQKVQKEHNAGHKILEYKTLVLIFITIIFPILSVFQIVYYKSCILSFNEIIFASSSVSDNFQLLQIMYNQVHLITENCQLGDQSNAAKSITCPAILEQTQRIYNILYPIMYSHVEYLIKNRTYMNHQYYIYELQLVTIEINGTKMQIVNYQYMEYFLEIVKRIMAIAENEKQNQQFLNNETYWQLIRMLKANWPQLAELNHNNLDLYENVGYSELRTVEINIIVMKSFYAFLILFFYYVFYTYYTRFSDLTLKILKLFRYIPRKKSQQLSQKYKTIATLLHMHNWSHINDYIVDLSYDSFSMSRMALSSSIYCRELDYRYTSPPKGKILGIILFAAMITVLIVKTVQMTMFYNICLNINDNINNIINSENYLLQAYFTHKNYYLFDIAQTNPSFQSEVQQKYQNMMADLQDRMANQQETDFIKYTLQAVDLFQDINDRYVQQFKAIIITSICKFQVEEADQEHCEENIIYRINQEGILAIMNSFQRNVYQQIVLLTKQPLNINNTDVDTQNKFYKEIFSNIDNQLIFMFKIYQQLQAKIVEGLLQTINTKIFSISMIGYVNIAIISISLLYWLSRYKKQCFKMAQNYGYLLVYPKEVTRYARVVKQTMTEIIEM